MPRRRTSPGAGLLWAENSEGDPGPVQHAGGGLDALAGPLVEGPGTADPVEVLDVVGIPGDDRDLEVQRLGPVGPLGLAQTPGVALFSTLRSMRPASEGNSDSMSTW